MKITVLAAVFAAVLPLYAEKVASVDAKSATGQVADFSDVISRCAVKPGSEYSPSACARDVKALRDSGEYEDISVETSSTPNGVAVTYVITQKSRYQGPLGCRGNEYFNASKIAKLADLKDGYAYGAADLAAAANRIRDEYRKKHFHDAKVTVETEPVDGSDGMVSVTMVVEEGARSKIKEYIFTGNEKVDSATLRESFGWYPWWNPLGWFNDDPVTAQDLAEARDKVAACYRNLGYLDATVSAAKREPREDGETSAVVFEVEEGPCYKVGAISVSGVEKYPAEAVRAAVKSIATGDIAGEKALNEAAHEIEVFCGSGEHPLAETRVTVKKIPSGDSGDLVDLVFDVEEGVPVTIDRVIVRGNDYTKDKVIRREISLSPGDPMIYDKAEQSKRRLENLRYFERVRYYLEGKPSAKSSNGEPDLRDLVYEVSERNTGQFMVGIGASSVDSVYATVELSESNFDLFNPWRFRGAGQKGRVLVQAGPRYQSYEVSVTEPQLFDRLLELTVEAYRRQRWFDDYDVIRNGAALTLSYPVKFWPTARTMGRLGFRLSAEYVEMDDVTSDKYYLEDSFAGRTTPEDEPGPVFKWQEEEYGDSWEIPLRIFWEDDTRDSFRFAKKGHRASIYGDIVGGDNKYWKVGFNYRQYITVWKRFGHVLTFGVRGETVDTFSGELPIYDKLFLGGPRSIRGVEYRDIAPRVWTKQGKKGEYVPWGGQTSWCLTAEYAIPVVKFVRIAGFTDLGSVGKDEFDFDNDYFCWSVGLGLRLDIESFPIRLDFAVPVVEPDDDVDKECFSFTIGYDF